MVRVGKSVPHRNAGPLLELLDRLLGESAEEDAVVDAPEDAGRVLDAFLLAEMDVGTREVFGIAAFVACGNLRRVARAGGRLLENERNLLAAQEIAAHACMAARFELRCEVDQVEHFLVGERRHPHEGTPLEGVHPIEHLSVPFFKSAHYTTFDGKKRDAPADGVAGSFEWTGAAVCPDVMV